MIIVNFIMLFKLSLNIFHGKCNDIYFIDLMIKKKNGRKNYIIKKICYLQKGKFMKNIKQELNKWDPHLIVN